MREKKEKIWEYLILSARMLLAYTLFYYGWAKINGNQFGISVVDLEKPINELSLFKLSWYLFEQEPFRSFIGVCQIITSLLLIYNRTLLIGALITFPILLSILIIDITFVKMSGFYWRLSYYLLLDVLILFHYRYRIVLAFKNILSGVNTKFNFPIWAYLILPIIIFALEIIGAIPHILINLFKEIVSS